MNLQYPEAAYDLYAEEYKPFDTIRWLMYLGSKRKLVNTIYEEIAKHTTPGQKVLDLFSGSGIIAAFLRHKGYIVHANDIAPYSAIINRVNLEIAPETLDYPNLTSFISELNSLQGPSVGHEYFSKYFSSNPQASTERLFYTRENGRFIDAVLEKLWTLEDGIIKDICLSDLLYKMSSQANTPGTFSSYYKVFGSQAGSNLNQIMSKIRIDKPIIYNGPLGKAYQMDAAQFLSQAGSYDLAYIDPPYNRRQYSGCYHLLEYASRPLHERYIPSDDQVTGVDPSLYKSPYSSKSQCFDTFSKMIELLSTRTKYIVMTYGCDNTCILSHEDIKNVLSKYGHISVSGIHKTGFQNKKNIEYIYTVTMS